MGRAETATYWNAHALGSSVCFFGKVFSGALRGGARCRFVEAQEGSGEAFGVPQRGTAYQPGVKPRVCRTTEAF